MPHRELFSKPRRILVIDDNHRIHEDIRKILTHPKTDDLADDAQLIFGDQAKQRTGLSFPLLVDSANQGKEGLDLAQQAVNEGRPYMLAFVDVRMPPGMDGIETVKQLWQISPGLQVVICTAYSDKPWHEINAELGASANLVILKKPFDNMEVLQLVQTLTHKWIVTKIAEARFGELEVMVEERTYQMIRASDAAKEEAEQRSAAQAAWMRAEERFQTAFEATRTALAILKAGTLEHTDANASYLALIGCTRTEVIGHSLKELAGTNAAHCFEPALAQLAAGNRIYNQPIEISHRQGGKRQALLTIEPMSVGNQPALLLALQDVTEQNRMEAELRQVQKLETIGQLAGGVAHDFNNVLAAISLHLTLLRGNSHLDAEATDTVRDIGESVDRAARLTRQLLEFSRRSTPQVETVHLQTLVEGTLAMLTRLLGSRISVQFENTSTHELLLTADPAMIEQVVMNLVINARDAMAGKGVLSISLRQIELNEDYPKFHPQGRAGSFIRLTVADTGTGMDEATLKRIFEPFFTTKAEGGTGLGLATVYRNVTQHQGWIQVESQLGVGSSFHVFFPAAEVKTHSNGLVQLPPVTETAPRTVSVT
jgi:PAS domain S-box-containing protein